MGWARFRSMLRRLLRARSAEQALDDEVQSYLQHEIDARIRSGIAPQEARREALVEFGGVEQVKEVVREARTGAWLDHLRQDVGYAIRRLARRPRTAIASITALACGIAAAAATWSLLTAVLLRPLPVRTPENLFIVGRRPVVSDPTVRDSHIYPLYPAVRDSGIFEALAAGGGGYSVPVAAASLPTPGMAYFASHDFFSTLGVRLALGREFRPEDDRRGARLVVVLSDRYWRQAFLADPNVVGREIIVSGRRATVVGVAPRGFRGLSLAEAPDLYLPLHAIADVVEIPVNNFFAVANTRSSPVAWITLIGRLRDGSDKAQAEARLANLAPDQFGGTFVLTNVNRAAIPEAARAGMAQFTRLLAFTVGLLLLIACLTAAMLLLIQTEVRRGEFAMRLALGAPRARIARGVVIEGALLSVAGAILAVPATQWLFAGIQLFEAPGGVRIDLLELSIDESVLLAAAGGAVVATLVIAVVAGMFAFSVNVQDALRGRTGFATQRLTASRTRSMLVIGQVAASLTLLAGAGLLGRSLIAALSLNPGYDTSRLVTGGVALGPYGYSPEQAAGFFGELRQRLSNNPSIRSISMTLFRGGMAPSGKLVIDGVPRQFPSMVTFTGVDQHYFSTVGLPIRAGRGFTSYDRAGAPRVTIVSESFGRLLSDGGNPVGRRITEPIYPIGRPADVIEVIGVVPDVITSIRTLEPLVMYMPLEQLPASSSRIVVLRASSDSASAVRETMSAIKQLDPAVTPQPLLTIDERLVQQMSPQRFGMVMLGGLGSVAALLTVLGAYVLAESLATSRRREISIRAALGGTGWRLGGFVLIETIRLVGVGLALGLVLAWMGSNTIRAFLFQVQPLDATTLAVVSALIFTAALAVSLGPAITATRVDLARVLREE